MLGEISSTSGCKMRQKSASTALCPRSGRCNPSVGIRPDAGMFCTPKKIYDISVTSLDKFVGIYRPPFHFAFVRLFRSVLFDYFYHFACRGWWPGPLINWMMPIYKKRDSGKRKANCDTADDRQPLMRSTLTPQLTWTICTVGDLGRKAPLVRFSTKVCAAPICTSLIRHACHDF